MLNSTVRSPLSAMIVVVLVVGCMQGQPLQEPAPLQEPVSTDAIPPTSLPEPINLPTAGSPSATAADACDIALDAVQNSKLEALPREGSEAPFVSGRFRVTADQIARHLDVGPPLLGNLNSADACYIDGAFDLRISMPAGADTTASRLFIVVIDGWPSLWAWGDDNTLPIENPASVEEQVLPSN